MAEKREKRVVGISFHSCVRAALSTPLLYSSFPRTMFGFLRFKGSKWCVCHAVVCVRAHVEVEAWAAT